jgi:urocanate reductase
MAAAAEACSRVSNVLVIEKMPIFGGNSYINGAGFNAWTDKLHMREKLKLGSDSAELHYQDTLNGGDYYNIPALVRTMVEAAPDALNWLIDEGVEFQPILNKMGGHSAFRAHVHTSGRGRGYVDAMKKVADRHGMKLRLNTQLTWIWRNDPTGPVLGVEVESPKGRSNIKVRKALVLAAGGFSRDIKMRQAYNPGITPEYNCTNQPGATGEVNRCALAVGADALDMEFIQFFPFADPDTGILDQPALIPNRGGAFGAIFVNKAGRRFVNESERRDVVSRAMVNTGSKPTYCIFADKMIVKMTKREEVDNGIAKGRILKADSIAELAQKSDLPAKALTETVAQHIGYLKDRKDPEFNKQLSHMMIALDEGPYYCIPQWPSVHHTCGGLRINTLGQVIDIWGNPIPRLYAAGEVAGGVQGSNRLGSNATPGCIVFGRIAGTNAAKEKE